MFAIRGALGKDDVVDHFDFQVLAGAHEVAGNGDTRFGRSRVTAGVICERE